jgi:pimeloyl-ACP methyl ester carboxylesterase
MAMDLRELMRGLNLPKIALVGHDRGARVATRFAKNHPEVLDRLVVMDNLRTRIVGRELDAEKTKGYWFFLFHLVLDLPVALIAGREDIWSRYFFSDRCFDPLTIQGEALETYVKAYRASGAIRGAVEDYRANASDVVQDNADASVKIACPVMSLWGHDFQLVGEIFDMPRVWAEMASNLVTHAIPECGPRPHEEKPEEINRLLIDFLAGWKG